MKTKDSIKTFLHAGSGNSTKENTTKGFNQPSWKELRLDINPEVFPDIIGSITNMKDIKDSSVDAVFSSHNIEHLYPYEVTMALKEFFRVLMMDGFLVITCPDLQSVCELVAKDKLTETAYVSPAGPIAPLDMLYGHRPSLASGNHFMAHRCGFTQKVLIGTLQSAGFKQIASIKRGKPEFSLFAIATKSSIKEDDLRLLAKEHFPVEID